MQNVSIPVPRQSDLFDAESAGNLTLPDAPALPETHRFVSPSGAAQARTKRISVEAKLAIAVSLLLHLALALVLSVRGMQSPPQMMPETLQATWVTWADASSLPEKKQEVAGAVQAPPTVAGGRQYDFVKVKTPAEAHPDVAADENAKTALFLDLDQKNRAEKPSDYIPAGPEAAAAEQKRGVTLPAAASPAAGPTAPASYTSMAKPRYRENASPVYPQSARLRGQEGVVLIRAEILPEGRTGVLKIKTSSGYDLLDQSALDTLRTWRFEPARRMGQPVAVWVDIPVRFVLKKND